MGRTQQRGRWPIAEQTLWKFMALLGNCGAGARKTHHVSQPIPRTGGHERINRLTGGAVEVSDTENVGGTALSRAVEDAVAAAGLVAAAATAVATAVATVVATIVTTAVTATVTGLVVGGVGEGGGSEGRDDEGGELHLDGCMGVEKNEVFNEREFGGSDGRLCWISAACGGDERRG